MSTITGTGWINNNACGNLDSFRGEPYKDLVELHDRLLDRGVFHSPVHNYRKMVTEARKTIVAAALALHHAGIDQNFHRQESIGIIGGGSKGCLPVNERYYADYLNFGKTMARGSLFAHTLPTSALAEVAIHFGMKGPLLYISSTEKPEEYLYGCAGSLIGEYSSTGIVAIWDSADSVSCMVITADDPGRNDPGLPGKMKQTK